MDIVSRVKNICLTPTAEWPVIAQEKTSTGELITGYVAPLAAVAAVAGFIGGSLVGRSLPFVGHFRVPIMAGLGGAVFVFVMAIVSILILGFIINALAPNFGGQKDSAQALKVAVYSYTPAWVAGVLQILPSLGVLALLAGLYGLYLLYLGLPVLMKCPQEKSLVYTVVVVVCAIVLSAVVGAVGGMVIGTGMAGSSVLGGAMGSGGASPEVQFDRDSAMGRLQDLGNRMEEANKKAEAAEKRGDSAGAAAAGMEALGILAGGGKRVEPVAVDQLTPLLPERFAGLPRTSSNAERSGFAGIMIARAEATYEDGDRSVRLEVTDTGGASGLAGLASWAGIQGERQDESGTERTQNVGGRVVHEKIAKGDGTNEFSVLLGQRFVVNAEGDKVSAEQLKAAVSALDLAKLEAMKDVGVQK
jgi:hypothetical protein